MLINGRIPSTSVLDGALQRSVPAKAVPKLCPSGASASAPPARSPYARLAGSGQADEPTDAANTTGHDIEAARRAAFDLIDRALWLIESGAVPDPDVLRSYETRQAGQMI
jgi:hypothetical protein